MAFIIGGMALGGSVISGIMGSRSQSQMISEMRAQRRLAQAKLDFAKDQWNTYRDTYGDIEKQMVADATAGVTGDYIGAANRAGVDIEGEFSRVQDENQRDMQRYGIDPSSGRYVSSDRAMGLQKATATALAKNTARQNERQRADDATWQRRQAIGTFGGNMIRGAQSDVTNAMGNMAEMAGQRAQYQGNLAGNLFSNAGQMAMMGGLSIAKGVQANKIPTTTPNNNSWMDYNPSMNTNDMGYGIGSSGLNGSTSYGLSNYNGGYQLQNNSNFNLDFGNAKYK